MVIANKPNISESQNLSKLNTNQQTLPTSSKIQAALKAVNDRCKETKREVLNSKGKEIQKNNSMYEDPDKSGVVLETETSSLTLHTTSQHSVNNQSLLPNLNVQQSIKQYDVEKPTAQDFDDITEEDLAALEADMVPSRVFKVSTTGQTEMVKISHWN